MILISIGDTDSVGCSDILKVRGGNIIIRSKKERSDPHQSKHLRNGWVL